MKINEHPRKSMNIKEKSQKINENLMENIGIRHFAIVKDSQSYGQRGTQAGPVALVAGWVEAQAAADPGLASAIYRKHHH